LGGDAGALDVGMVAVMADAGDVAKLEEDADRWRTTF